MKFSLFHNDKSTIKDEVILALFIACWAASGILLLVYRPTFWFVKESESVVLGALCLITAVMFIPGLIYRLLTNSK